MSTLKTNNIEHLDASSPSIQTTIGGGVIFAGLSTFVGNAEFDGNVNIAGTITYDDVTNIDSVGLITARIGVSYGAPGAATVIDGNAAGIGIGTDNPASTLHIQSPSGSTTQTFTAPITGTQPNIIKFQLKDGTPDAEIKNESAKLIFATGSSSTARLIIDSNGRILVGPGAIATPKCGYAGIDVPNYDYSIVMGGSDGNGNRADNTIKDGKFCGAHYVNAEEPVGIIRYSMGSSASELHMGGGSSLVNAATQLSFWTAANTTTTTGSERLRITSDGKILIGTTSAGYSNGADTFTIAESGHCGMTIRSGTSSMGSIYFSDGTSGSAEYRGYIDYNHTTDALRIATAGSTAMSIDSAGKMGLGTASPGSYNGAADNLVIKDSADAGITIRSGSSSDGGIYFNDTDDGNQRGIIRFDHGTDALAFHTPAGESMRIDSSGNVAINNTSPNYRLDINGEVGITEGQPVTWHDGSGNPSAQLWGDSSDNMIFRNGAAGNERMRITANGNIGIGIATPDSTLHIQSPSGSTTQTFTAPSGQPNKIQFRLNNGTLDAEIKNESAGLRFSTGSTPTERMRIGSGGMVDYFASSGWESQILYNQNGAGGTRSFIVGRHSATALTGVSGTIGTISFRVYTNGDVENTNDSYGQISDEKLKENIIDAGSQWDDFKAVRFRKYNFKEETGHETHTQLGVIAQELELTSPGLVYETIDKDEDGNDLGTTTKAVKSSILTKKALVALQEAMARIETLETEVATLKGS